MNKPTTKLSIIYYVRPLPKSIENMNAHNQNIMLPHEFIDLAKTKLRGEAYKLCNEDTLSAKWLADYNALLETFTQWINDKRPNFGL